MLQIIIVFFFYFTKQNNWVRIIPHQILLLIALVIFLFDLILLPITAFVSSKSKFVRFTYDWIELDVSEKENIAQIVIKECIISAVFAGNFWRKFQFTASFWHFKFHIFILGLCTYAIYLLHSLNLHLERWLDIFRIFDVVHWTAISWHSNMTFTF